jgi:phospholipase/carboxylesterase
LEPTISSERLGVAAPALWRRATGTKRGPLVVLLHGHGVDESDLFGLADLFPRTASVAALRGPIAAEGGFRWFAHHEIGRPLAVSIEAGMTYVETWLDGAAGATSGIWLAGFSGGATIAGALLLRRPERYAGVAMLHGALPFDAGIPIEPDQLAGCHVFYGYGERDAVIPPALIARSREYLSDASGAAAEIHGYRAAHEIPAAEQRDLARWFGALS